VTVLFVTLLHGKSNAFFTETSSRHFVCLPHHHSLESSRTFQDQTHFPGLSRPGNCTQKNPGLFRSMGTLYIAVQTAKRQSRWAAQLTIKCICRYCIFKLNELTIKVVLATGIGDIKSENRAGSMSRQIQLMIVATRIRCRWLIIRSLCN